MRARGHVIGGTLAGTAVAGAASVAGLIPGPGAATWWAVMATTLFFSLLPDVDTDSLPRRWFYRAALAALLWLAWKGQWKQATALAVLSTLPLVDHHRGWTHWRWSPVLGGVVLSLCYLWWCGRLDGVVLASQLLTRVEVAFLLAAACGWYTHLVLDGLLRLFPPDPL